MSSDLYEQLGIAQDASPEQVKKAYKKRALQTHPDRLPQGASQSERERAAEEFRKVNNAYEILSDQEKRTVYDRHGVWPPPTEIPQAAPSYSAGGRAFGADHDPFFSTGPNLFFGMGRGGAFFGPGFTDPFRIFEEVFGSRSFPAGFDDGFAPRGQRQASFDPFEGIFGSGGMSMGFGGGGFPMFSSGSGSQRIVFSSSSSSSSSRPGVGWVSESHSSRTINGRTESVTKRTDASGNEYATYTSSDGTVRHTLNGAPHDGSPPRAIADGTERSSRRRDSSRNHPPPPIAYQPPPPMAYQPPPGPPPVRRGRYDSPPPIERYHSPPTPTAAPPPRRQTRPNAPGEEQGMRDERNADHLNDTKYDERLAPYSSKDGRRRERSLDDDRHDTGGHNEKHKRHSWGIFDRLKRHHHH
ncbi:DnaJ-domain-containing protein [Peniophora sp. CONT]|nr:DnaJ-domain-containing protein [Peniophora sp. CONT]